MSEPTEPNDRYITCPDCGEIPGPAHWDWNSPCPQRKREASRPKAADSVFDAPKPDSASRVSSPTPASSPQNTLAPCPQEWTAKPVQGTEGKEWALHDNLGVIPGSGYHPECVAKCIARAHNASLLSLAPCPIKDEGEETTELKISEAKADNVNAVLRNDRESPFQDSPLLAAKRRAFDNPTLANLDLLIDEAIKATHRLTRQSIAEHLAKACQWLDEFVEMPEMFPSDRDVQWWEERRQGIRDLARQALPSEHGGGSTTSGASLENPSPSVSDSNAAQLLREPAKSKQEN